uniref:Histone-lysine N-methyltransferase, H3 lysine-4 specific n=1 Tax=Mycena chlorophos TaxID=658473 RepID=A0ABQ0L3W0_MYCCL|nr:predicted protein [Mycena chlorophos]
MPPPPPPPTEKPPPPPPPDDAPPPLPPEPVYKPFQMSLKRPEPKATSVFNNPLPSLQTAIKLSTKPPSPPPPPSLPPRTSPRSTPSPLPTPSTSKLTLDQPPPPKPESPKPVLYSLPPLPEWPPPRSAYPDDTRSFRVLFDPAVDGVPSTTASTSSSRHASGTSTRESAEHWRKMIEHVRSRCPPDELAERIRGKGKGREIMYRMEGQVVGSQDGDEMCEDELIVRDPRRVAGYKPPRPPKEAYTLISYEHDANTPGPPPTTVLLAGFPALTPNKTLQTHLSQYGTIEHFGRQMDTVTGATLGVVCVRFRKVEEAKRCVDKEDGVPSGSGLNVNGLAASVAGEERRAVLDPEGLVLKAYLKGMMKKDDKPKAVVVEPKAAAPSTPVGPPANGHPLPPIPPPPTTNGTPAPKPLHPSLPLNPMLNAGPAASAALNSHPYAPWLNPNSRLPQRPMNPNNRRPQNRSPSPQLDEKVRARLESSRDYRDRDRGARDRGRRREDDVYIAPRRERDRDRDRHRDAERQREREREREERERQREREREREREKERARDKVKADVRAALSANGRDHVKIKLQTSVDAVSDDDVAVWIKDFKADVDKILRDHEHIYVTFVLPKTAMRVERVLGTTSIGYHSVTLSVHAAPAPEAGWGEKELLNKAQEIVLRELGQLVVKDINDRVVAPEVRFVMGQWKSEKERVLVGGVGASGAAAPKVMDLKSLSFKKARKQQPVEPLPEPEPEPHSEEDEEPVPQPPKKKRKKEAPVKKAPKRPVRVESEDENVVESEDELVELPQKRPLEVEEGEEPVTKRVKLDDEEDVAKVAANGSKKTAKKKQPKTKRMPSVDDVVVLDAFEPPPVVADLRLTPPSPLSRSPSPSPISEEPPPRTPTPLPDVFEVGLCEDDEDLYFAKLVLSGAEPEPTLEELIPPPAVPDAATLPLRKHLTGSARTEGFYKISHAEKMAYVQQYQSRGTETRTAEVVVDEPPAQHVESSRSNRANARRRAQGLEEFNQVQRAVALSKGETAAANEVIKFNQLQTRKKHLRFGRSSIHDWGLYAMEKISRGEMVIEYVGEIIRAQVAEKREKAYERQGIGSSYLFRIDEDLVVDATKKGNLGRLINHSCDPNCNAKIITINGEKKIVIYAKQDIELGDEITYDYHFPFEQDKIPCLCGSAKCRGFLN